MAMSPFDETSNLLTADWVWMLVRGALMFLRSQTLTERSSDPETIWSAPDRCCPVKTAQVTLSVWPYRERLVL